MLMSAPAGAYNIDEIKVTDSGASALCLAYARFLSGESELGMVVSWCKSSKTNPESVMLLRGDPFYTRPLGVGTAVSDALFAQAVGEEYGVTEQEVNERVVSAFRKAAGNERGMRHPVPDEASLVASPLDATPLRAAQRAPYTDGAAALVLATDTFLDANPECHPLARLSGVGWASDSYRLEAKRLRAMNSARAAWQTALSRAGLKDADDLDVIELDSQTGYHEAAYVRAFGIKKQDAVSPSGGPFAQNPYFCTGLVNAVEAVLQVSNQAGAVQRDGVRRAAAHGCHGCAQQGNVVMVFEAAQRGGQ